MNTELYVAVMGLQIVVPQGEFRMVSDLARAWAKDNKQSPKVLSLSQYARLPEQIAQAKERRDAAARNSRISKNAIKAANKTKAMVLAGQYTAEQLNQAIKLLDSTGQYRNSDVLNKALMDQPLSAQQVAWLMSRASAHRSAVATKQRPGIGPYTSTHKGVGRR